MARIFACYFARPSMRILAVIPARYESSRLPGKPLADIGGRSMVLRVVDQVAQANAPARVVVATDDERIAAHVRAAGAEAVMTDAGHASGTDRCHEALQLLGAEEYDAVVNIQGDEPFIAPGQVDEVCATLADAPGGIATLVQQVADDHSLDDPGEVRVTTDVTGHALYFSRAVIPHLRDPGPTPLHTQFKYLKHVGLYAYTCGTLARIVRLAPSPLELAEGLEQLRWLENGLRVRVGHTAHHSFCVDTPADLAEARLRASRHGGSTTKG